MNYVNFYKVYDRQRSSYSKLNKILNPSIEIMPLKVPEAPTYVPKKIVPISLIVPFGSYKNHEAIKKNQIYSLVKTLSNDQPMKTDYTFKPSLDEFKSFSVSDKLAYMSLTELKKFKADNATNLKILKGEIESGNNNTKVLKEYTEAQKLKEEIDRRFKEMSAMDAENNSGLAMRAEEARRVNENDMMREAEDQRYRELLDAEDIERRRYKKGGIEARNNERMAEFHRQYDEIENMMNEDRNVNPKVIDKFNDRQRTLYELHKRDAEELIKAKNIPTPLILPPEVEEEIRSQYYDQLIHETDEPLNNQEEKKYEPKPKTKAPVPVVSLTDILKPVPKLNVVFDSNTSSLESNTPEQKRAFYNFWINKYDKEQKGDAFNPVLSSKMENKELSNDEIKDILKDIKPKKYSPLVNYVASKITGIDKNGKEKNATIGAVRTDMIAYSKGFKENKKSKSKKSKK